MRSEMERTIPLPPPFCCTERVSGRKQTNARVDLLTRKAEENQQIMAELERIKASYAERLRGNPEGLAREKATFGNWLTTKQ